MPSDDIQKIRAQSDAAFTDQSRWRFRWQEAWTYLAPERDLQNAQPEQADHVYDSSPMVATRGLVNAITAGLMPPWARWFRLAPGIGVPPDDRIDAARMLDRITRELNQHIQSSNFYAELQPTFLDLG